MNAQPKVCKRAARLLQQAFAGELHLQDRLWWESHRAQCPACDGEAQDQDQVVDALATYREAPLQRVDLDRFVDRVQARLEPREAVRPSAASRWAGGRPLLVAAAALACLGAGWWWLQGGADQDSFDDSVPLAEGPANESNASPPSQPGPNPSARSPKVGDGARNRAESLQAAGLVEKGEAFDEDRRTHVLRQLREQLAGAESERAAYLQALRRDGWPVANLLARVAQQSGPVANPLGGPSIGQVAVAELAQIGDRASLRHLGSLHDHPAVGEAAVSALLAARPVAFEWATRLYTSDEHRDAVRSAWNEWTPAEAREGAARLQRPLARAARRGSLEPESLDDLANLLARGGPIGLGQGLDWLVEAEFGGPAGGDPWVAALAPQAGLDQAVNAWLGQREGRPWRRQQVEALLPLAAEHLDPVWTSWVAQQCRDSQVSSEALPILGRLPQPAALSALYRLRDRSGVDREAWVAAWRTGLDLDRERTDRLSTHVVRLDGSESERQESLRAYGEALLLAPGKNTSRAMVWVAQSLTGVDALALALWEQAALHGDAWTLDLVQHAWMDLADNESRKAAAVFLCAGRLGGEPVLREWLAIEPQAMPSPQDQRRVDAACQPSNRSFRERVYLLERSMRDALGARPSVPAK